MPLTELLAQFERLKKVRRVDPRTSLRLVGAFAKEAVTVLESRCDRHAIAWKGEGEKTYEVFTAKGSQVPFSRPANASLFVHEPEIFEGLWARFLKAVLAAEKQRSMRISMAANDVDSALYTAVVGYAAVADLFGGRDRGGPGTFFEMAVGPTISLLSGRTEGGAVSLPIPDTDESEEVPVDLTFPPGEEGGIVLVVATKISTRERISQAFVHQRFLDVLSPGGYRSVMAICNENNVMAPKRAAAAAKTPAACWLQDTLVPGTIAKYERYIAHMHGLYYADPPTNYLSGRYPGLPAVKRLSSLFREDLPLLLDPNVE
jgi:hypothetical protein